MALVCPITSNMKVFPLHVKIGEKNNIKGIVMCEQIKAIDFVTRNAIFKEKLCNETYEQVLNIINSFIELEK